MTSSDIKIIYGKNNGRFPFSHSLLIDGGERTLIDTGAGTEALKAVQNERRVETVVNTHAHFDHVWGNNIFDGARFLTNPLEAHCYGEKGIENAAHLLGIVKIYGEQEISDWVVKMKDLAVSSPHSARYRVEWLSALERAAEPFPYDEDLFFGGTRVRFIHTPGHTKGFCCPFLPDYGLLFSGDYDLSRFGPWYGNIDSDIDEFIDSAARILETEPKEVLTGHEAGLMAFSEFKTKLSGFLGIIDIRDERILAALEKPQTYDELARTGLIYHRKFLVDGWIAMWEKIMIEKHIVRLAKRGVVSFSDGYYYKV
ncbi:MAG: MBL fold metallo-hydrolase [Myxococcota bacterium]